MATSVMQDLARRRAMASGRWGRAAGAGGPEAPRNPLEGFDYRDPMASWNKFNEVYPQGRALGQVDPAILEALMARNYAESGGRQRAVLNRLRTSPDMVAPGQYGVTAALADIQGQSDLSRATSDAYLQEAGRARGYREQEATGLQDYLRNYQDQLFGFHGGVEREKVSSGLAEKRQGRKPLGISVGIPGGPSVGFAQGGVVDEPTNALIGEGGQAEYVIPENELMEILSGDTLSGLELIRARMDAARQGRGFLGGGGPGMAPRRSMEMRAGEAGGPIPFREPEPVQPQGFWEKLADYMPEIKVDASASGGAKVAGGLAMLASMPGRRSLERRKGERERATKFVGGLNERQKEEQKEGRAHQRAIELKRTKTGDQEFVRIPELGEDVPKYGTVHSRWQVERLMKHYRSKEPKPTPKGPGGAKTPPRSPGMKASVGYWTKELRKANVWGLPDIITRLKAEPDSVRRDPEIQALLRLRREELAAGGHPDSLETAPRGR